MKVVGGSLGIGGRRALGGGRRAQGAFAACVAAITLATPVTGCQPDKKPVTGNDPVTHSGEQSETAISVNPATYAYVTDIFYNDDTDVLETVDFSDPENPVIGAGTSTMGWSYSIDSGKTWTYGGRVPAPADYPILWGDPAVASSRPHPRYVFASNLAVPAANIPSGGVPHDGLIGALGGACIARSTDYGQTFEMYQCFTNGHGLDGGSMATAPDGRICVAYNDLQTTRPVVWCAANEDGTFSELPEPFAPGFLASPHPEIAFDGANRLYLIAPAFVIALGDKGTLLLRRWNGSNWEAPNTAVNPKYAKYPYKQGTLQFSDRKMRLGRQFSFAVGTPSQSVEDGTDQLRVVYTTQDADGRFYLTSAKCSLNLYCQSEPGWGTQAYSSDQFQPTLAVAGGGSKPIVWKVSYWSRELDPYGNTIKLRNADEVVLPGGGHVLRQQDAGSVPYTPCTSTNHVYWGDYDEMKWIPSAGAFVRAFSDSSTGCVGTLPLRIAHLHVSAVLLQSGGALP